MGEPNVDGRQALVRDIVEANRYLNLATTDGHAPWVATVEYVVDEALHFYFISLETSRHAQHIQQHPAVGVSIYDSTQPTMTARGIQIEGEARKFHDEQNPFTTFGDRSDLPERLSDIDPGYAAYRIEPHRCFVPESLVREGGLDRRVDVPMDEWRSRVDT